MKPEIIYSIIANLLTTVLLILISVIFYLLAIAKNRRRYHAIFGLRRSMNQVMIYLSAVDVAPSSTDGTEPLETGFTGLAIQRAELIPARRLEAMLGSAPIPSYFKPLDYVLGRLFFSFSRIKVSLDVAYKGLKPDPIRNLILVGTRVYNHLTFALVREVENPHQHERAIDPFFVYGRNDLGERTFIRNPHRERNSVMSHGPEEIGRVPGEKRSDQLAVVERHWDVPSARVIFLICGVGSLATASAIKFVVEQYSDCCRFQDKFGKQPNKDWAILLKVEDETDDLVGAQSYEQIPAAIIQRLVTDGVEHDSSRRVHLRLDEAMTETELALRSASN
jgi:hypothetical protein